MTVENSGPAGDDAAASGATRVMSVHTLPAPGETLLGPAGDEAEALGTKKGHAGDIGAVPVMVFAPPPPWTARPGRRPVVAVLDSGVEPHPWLAGSAADPVVWHASQFGWNEQPLPTPEGFLGIGIPPGAFRGHATFVAGVIRQTAPAARILSVPVMSADGAVDSDQSQRALTKLSELVRSGQADRFVDVICLAFGYETDGPADDDPQTKELHDVLKTLTDQGVLIVASAGNRGEATPMTYPAAFALHADPPVISVGAKNPDGKTAAYYSNHGEWVTYQAIGSGVISTFPEYDGDQKPLIVGESYPNTIGFNIDPDDFNSGFARWSGTSFSAARIAGLLARELSSAPDLADLSPAAANRRAKAALAAIKANRWQPQQ